MPVSRWSVAAGLSATLIVVLGAAPHRGENAEVRRIRFHFDSALTELSLRNTSALSARQRVHRASLIDTLRAYRDRGVFPHNYDFPGQAVPYFVDRKTGTLCAVANLLASTGRRDIVDRVAATNNNVWVAQLAGDSAFTHWLDDNGLTLDEAARIQVPYVAGPTTDAQAARNTAFAVIAPLAIGGAALTSVWNSGANADGHRAMVSRVGMGAGLVAVTAGTLMLTKSALPAPYKRDGIASALIGGVSMALSAKTIHRHRAIVAEQESSARKLSVADATLSPIVTTGVHPSAGLALSLRY